MALDLGSDVLAKVKDLLTSAIASSKVYFGTRVWLNASSVEPVTHRVLDTLNKRKRKLPWVTNDALTAFFTEQLEQYLTNVGLTSEESGVRFDVAHDPIIAAEELSQALETLPWSYRLLAPTPMGDDVRGPDEIRLDDTYHLARYSLNAVARLPGLDVDRDPAGEYDPDADGIWPGTYYLHGRVSGYIRHSEPTAEVDEFVHTLKGLLGLVLVANDVMFDSLPSSPPARAIAITVYRVSDSGALQLMPCKRFALEDSAIINRLRVAGPRGWGDASMFVDKVADAFVDQATRSSARWFLDSCAETRGMVQIVQATISLEILLGDRRDAEELGIASLLANRLAYLIGSTPKERQRVLVDFKRLYDIRSKIVHSGKAALNDSERMALADLQRYAYRAISAQISGLRAERGSAGEGSVT